MTGQNQKIGNYRYRILALVFMATTINYFDRSLVGVMALLYKNYLSGQIKIMQQ